MNITADGNSKMVLWHGPFCLGIGEFDEEGDIIDFDLREIHEWSLRETDSVLWNMYMVRRSLNGKSRVVGPHPEFGVRY